MDRSAEARCAWSGTRASCVFLEPMDFPCGELLALLLRPAICDTFTNVRGCIAEHAGVDRALCSLPIML